MHTLKVILLGFVLLVACFFVGRWLGGAGATAAAMKCFLAVWFVGTLINMWMGVSGAGYSIKDEAPVAVLVFAVPAIAAVLLWWKLANP